MVIQRDGRYCNVESNADSFSVRLEEANYQSQTILAKPIKQYEDPFGLSCTPGLRKGVESDILGSIGQAENNVENIPSYSFIKEALVSGAKQSTENQFSLFLESLIQRKIAEIVDPVLSKANVVTLFKKYEEQNNVLNNVLLSLKHQNSKIEALQNDFGLHKQHFEQELSNINKTFQDLYSKTHLIEQHTTSCVDKLLKKHDKTARDYRANFERYVHKLKDEIEYLVYQLVFDWKLSSNELELHVDDLHGAVNRIAGVVNAQTNDLQNLMEAMLEKQSDVRSCQDHVNRLEALFPYDGKFLDRILDRKGVKAENFQNAMPLRNEGNISPSKLTVLHQELTSTKEKVNLLCHQVHKLGSYLGKSIHPYETNDDKAISNETALYEMISNGRKKSSKRGFYNSRAVCLPNQGPPFSAHRLKGNEIVSGDKLVSLGQSKSPLFEEPTELEMNSGFFCLKKPLRRSRSMEGTESCPSSEYRDPHEKVEPIVHTQDSYSSDQNESKQIQHPQKSSETACQFRKLDLEQARGKTFRQDFNSTSWEPVVPLPVPVQAESREQKSKEGLFDELSNNNKKAQTCSSPAMDFHDLPSDDRRKIPKASISTVNKDAKIKAINPCENMRASDLHHVNGENKVQRNSITPQSSFDQYPPVCGSDSESERNNFKLCRLAID